MSAEIQNSAQAIQWQPSLRASDRPPRPLLRHWLAYEGLLTVKMKQACGDGFRLQLLGPGPRLLVDEERSRRVIMWCREQPCVYAESCLPREVLAMVPGLRNLGSDPLGEALQTHPDVSRTDFEYALLGNLELPSEIGDEITAPLWARRSSFVIGGISLPVAEVFLPAIQRLSRQSRGHSGT